MVQHPIAEDGPAPAPLSAGARLREARLAAGMDLGEVARATRIPLRHLEAIEASNYQALPSTTYATGFTKAYARAVGIDEVEIAQEVREELAQVHDPRQWQPYETADPKRVPPRLLAWTGALVALIVIVAFGWWYANRYEQNDVTVAPPAAEGTTAAPGSSSGGNPGAVQVPITPSGQVVLTATQPVWLRITDAAGTRLLEKEMAAGERYEVPASAQSPTLRAGRPEGLTVTVGGQPVAPLGPAGRPVSGVVLTAEALNARAAATPPGDNVATPAP